jgi:DNA invertase Pin-like site-specific DNA recombinase
MAIQPTDRHPTRRRAVGIVRVSHVGDRKGDSFISPSEQRQQIERHCALQHMDVVAVYEELDVSGGTPLLKRPGLRRAVSLVERGDADVVVAAYFDRLVRDLSVQREMLERVEQAGGAILAIDAGEISARTASRWLSSTMLGMVAEYHRRITSEKVAAARVDAVERGVVPWAHIIPGYRRGPGGVLEAEPSEAPHVAEAFRMRALGSSLSEVREYLAKHGIRRSYRATKSLLTSRLVLGEVVFGNLRKAEAHEPIIDRVTWQRCQDVRLPRGRRPKSTRLLARLNLLKCGSCGAAMVAATVKSHGKPYPVYRCGMSPDCSRGAAISCDLIEAAVVAKVIDHLERARRTGSASPQSHLAEKEAELLQKQANLDAAIVAFDGLHAASVNQRLLEMQAGVDTARQEFEQLRATAAPAEIVDASRWHEFNPEERRMLIRATIRPFAVWPGRGPSRFKIEAFGE